MELNVIHDSVPLNSGPHSWPAGFLDCPFPVCIFVVTCLPNQNETSGLYRAFIGLYDEYYYFKKFGLEQAFQPKTKLYHAMGMSVFKNPESNWQQTKLLSFLNLILIIFFSKNQCRCVICFLKATISQFCNRMPYFSPIIAVQTPSAAGAVNTCLVLIWWNI